MEYDLVFEGGGAKGMAFVGAMAAFEAAGHTYRRVIGSSAGAITALTLAAGYTAAEMQTALSESVDDRPVFTSFLGEPSLPEEEGWMESSAFAGFLRSLDKPLIPDRLEARVDKVLLRALAANSKGRHLLSFMDYGGWFAADAFVGWLERKLDEDAAAGRPRHFGRLTFAELHERTGIDLSLTGSDVTNNHLLILNHRTAPDLPVVWGTRMSMSLPLVWQEVVWQEEWGRYRGHSATGHVIVDGGLLSNFPIELLVSDAAEVAAVMGPRPDNPVLGFLIDERLPVPGAPAAEKAGAAARLGELRTVQRLKGLVDTVTQARDKSVIASNERRVVRLPARGFGTTEFDMTEHRRAALVEAGRAATQAHLDAAGGLESMEVVDTAESDRIAVKMLDMSDF